MVTESPPLICAYCKEPIGKTEQAVMIWTQETSPEEEAEPVLENLKAAAVAHHACWEREGPARPDA